MALSQQTQLAKNLAQLARDYQSGIPEETAELKRSLKDRSKNDLVRTVAYLVEVIAARDGEFKAVQKENVDLRELLKLNNIELDEGADEKGNSGDAGHTPAQATNENAVETGGAGTEQSGILSDDKPNKFGNEANLEST